MGTNRKRFWALLWLTARMEFRLRYHGSFLGYAWSLLHPLLLFGVVYIFFTQVIRFGGRVDHYAVLLLLNIMLFGFFSEAATSSLSSLVSRERTLRSTDYPRILVPLSGVLTSMFSLAVGLPVAFFFMLVNGVEPTWTWILTPVILVCLLTVTIGLALILSTLYVTIRDVAQIWAVAARALFYASPIVYTIDFVPESWRSVAYANPIAPILTQARVWLVDPSAPNAWTAPGGSLGFIPALAVLGVIVAVGLWLFVRRAPRVAELL